MLDFARLREAIGTPTPTRRLDDADVIELAGREWVALHTPGHTPDHLCLFDPTTGLVLSGDHVLPTITPHISGLTTAADPLAQFFASLDRMHELSGRAGGAARRTATRSSTSTAASRPSSTTTRSVSTACGRPPRSSGGRPR